MKKFISILSGLALIGFGLNSCKKDNINGDYADLPIGSYITLEKVNNTNLNFSDPAATVSRHAVRTHRHGLHRHCSDLRGGRIDAVVDGLLPQDGHAVRAGATGLTPCASRLFALTWQGSTL